MQIGKINSTKLEKFELMGQGVKTTNANSVFGQTIPPETLKESEKIQAEITKLQFSNDPQKTQKMQKLEDQYKAAVEKENAEAKAAQLDIKKCSPNFTADGVDISKESQEMIDKQQQKAANDSAPNFVQ